MSSPATVRLMGLLLLVVIAGCASQRPAPQVLDVKPSVVEFLAGVAEGPLTAASPGQKMTTDDGERLELEIHALQALWARLFVQVHDDRNLAARAIPYESLHWREGSKREDEAVEAMNLMNQAILRGEDAEARRQWNAAVKAIRACHAHLDLARASLRGE